MRSKPPSKKQLDEIIPKRMDDLDAYDVIEIETDVEQLILSFAWKSKIDNLEVRSCCMLFDNLGIIQDNVYWANKISGDNSVKKIGKDTEEYDQYSIRFSDVQAKVNVIIGTLSLISLNDEKLQDVGRVDMTKCLQGCFVTISDARNPSVEIGKFNVTITTNTGGSIIMCKISRKSPSEPFNWRFTTLGDSLDVFSVVDLIPEVQTMWAENWVEMFKWSSTKVIIVEAKDILAANKKSNHSNAYVMASIFGKTIKTPVKPKTLNPSWDYPFEFGMVKNLQLGLFHEAFGGNQYLGEVSVDINSLSLGVLHDIWVDLISKDKKVRSSGSLHLKIFKTKK